MNRSEWMANRVKNDATAYEWVPEVMTSIDPSPAYAERGYPKVGGRRLTASRRASEGAAAFRSSLTNVQQKQERARVGRLYAHVKLMEMRDHIREARTQEGKYDPDADLDPTDKAKAILKAEQASGLPNVKIDDEFKLPYGFGYDEIIKERADLINDKKFLNNQLMDELVEQLGYLDYRDALAANKYILQTKRDGDYRQAARAKALSLAFSRMTRLKREQIEQRAMLEAQEQLDQSNEAETAPEARREALEQARTQKKLEILMNEDSTVAQLYQESFKAAKADGEREMDQLRDLHDRFDHYLDEERMSNKLSSEWYDLKAIEDAEHVQYSTDFTEQDDDVVYKRYKMQQYRTREEIKDHQARIDHVLREAEAPGAGAGDAQREAADEAGVDGRSHVTLLHRLRSKKYELVEHDQFLVGQIAELRYRKALRHKGKLREHAVYGDDPIFGDARPDWAHEPNRLQELALFPELRKMEFSTLPERPAEGVVGEESARDFEDERSIRHSYYKAKLAFFEDCFQNQRQLKSLDFEAKREAAEAEDEWMDSKLEFMYDAFDYDHDRAKVRDKFLNEVNKRVTLADVGETLDKLIYESKGESAKYYDVVKHHSQKPRAATKEYTSDDFKWSGHLLRSLDPKSPLWLDDPNQIDEAPEAIAEKAQEVYDRVKYEDEQTDHSYASLSKTEKTEIALFHSLKQDPFFKHYIHNHLRQQAEHEDEANFHFPLSLVEKRDIYDHVKLDKMNLFDFRRNLPMKERQARIDSKARAYGYGKRKRSRALVSVEPGSGKITVNGKPLLQALLLPMQRSRILLPLIATQYTCLLDVKIRLWGGGFNGQVEAIIPALARALQGFDVQTRKPLKHLGLMRHDPRTKERKKIGKQKARKGQVYRRR